MIIIFVQTGNLSKHYFHTGNRTLKGKKYFSPWGSYLKLPQDHVTSYVIIYRHQNLKVVKFQI